ncbi:MAG: hypothetical protein K6G07_06900 [Lachnospiraceae bacterium]|nr:hypothetical protein [Lachnospiraceae bacterium]
MKEISLEKRIIMVLFVLAISVGFVLFHGYGEVAEWVDYFIHYDDKVNSVAGHTLNSMEADFSGDMPVRSLLVDLNGIIAKTANMDALYNDKNIYISQDDRIVSVQKKTSTDYEYMQVLALKDFLDENGIRFLYVNLPDKYTDDAVFSDEFAIESYSNRNADLLMKRLEEDGVSVLDIRDDIVTENKKVRELFYRTDHHPTVETGLWIASRIADRLDEECGYHIGETFFYPEYYDRIDWQSCWLGSQGKTVGQTYIAPDDYTVLLPLFPTDYTFQTEAGPVNGAFELYLNDDYLAGEKDIYRAESRHDVYYDYSCVNHLIGEGKVLIIEDSYGRVIEPFLSLGIHETDTILMREYKGKFDLKSYILENGYDTVIVSYSQNMIGEHDDPTSVNRYMFSFVSE